MYFEGTLRTKARRLVSSWEGLIISEVVLPSMVENCVEVGLLTGELEGEAIFTSDKGDCYVSKNF
jgi:hypothetical protein